MPIAVEDVKLMASQRLADTDDGGGQMTGNEVVDGNVNNLFDDISRMDRTYGRVSLREAFVAVQTADNDTYSGAHVIVSLPAKDPNVNVCLFQTGNSFDERAAAREYIESYVVKGARFPGWLWGDHPAGSRSLLLFVVKGSKAPSIGDVLYLSGGEGQYVRITSITVTTTEFVSTSESSEYGSMAARFSRDIFEIEIGDALRENQPGLEITQNDAIATSVYSTMVYDAAKYYGVMLPTTDIDAGDVAINVDTIYTHLVPSAQGESPLTDLSVGEAGPVIGSGGAYTLTVTGFSVADGNQFNFNRGIEPGSLSFVYAGHTLADDSTGVLYEGTAQRGTVDYATGTLAFSGVTASTTTVTATARIGVEATRISNTASRPVELSTQGYNYTSILDPLPSPNTLMVDYMAQGTWYRLRDNGAGFLVPDVEGTGTGKVNYATGSVVLTCAALPDVGSSIIHTWGSPLEVEDLAGEVVLDVAEISHQVGDAPINPGSLALTWPSGSGTATATDDGSGNLAGDATGTVNYATGRIRWKPTQLPDSGSEYTIVYDKYPVVTASVAGSVAGGVATFNLPSAPLVPGTCGISVTVTWSDGSTHTYELADNGGGNLAAAGGGTTGAPDTLLSTAHTYSGITGTVDYTTGVVQVSLAGASGSRKEYLYDYRRWTYSGNTSDLQWVQWLKGTETTGLTATGISGNANVQYTLTGAAIDTAEETVSAPPFVIDLLPETYGKTILPGSVNFVWGGVRYVDRNGRLYRNPLAATGQGVEVGTIDYAAGTAEITTYDAAPNTLTLQSLVVRFGRQFIASATFRTPGAPLRPASLQIQGVAADGRTISGLAEADGTLSGTLCKGVIDYDLGIVELAFGEMVTAADCVEETWYDADDVEGGLIWKPVSVFADQLVYACVVYSYIPLDADLIGIDPVRLPVDGRVPIVKAGDVVVIHNTQETQLTDPLAAGQVITFLRDSISHVELYDANDTYVPSTFYTWDEDAQTLTMADPLDLSAFTQPLVAMHRIEDQRLVISTQINGQVILDRGVSCDYPASGTYVSSALKYGDLRSRSTNMFDQKTWTGVWSDALIGDQANAGYNEIDYPVSVTNQGAVTERWALVFDSTEHFTINSEKRGVVGSGYITQDCQPVNAATGQPYWFLDYRGWGTGWASGNVLRFDTEGANRPLWIARTTLQGPVAEPNDQYTIQIRGDAQ